MSTTPSSATDRDDRDECVLTRRGMLQLMQISLPTKCTRCDRPMDVPIVCSYCHQIFDIRGLDHFASFGLPAVYDIDENLLRRRYLELSRESHPDSAGDSNVATQFSAKINSAFHVLSDPLLRAEYLLEMRGGPSAAQRRTVSAEILAWTLAMREQIAEAREQTDQAAINRIRVDIQSKYDAALAEISEASRTWNGAAQDLLDLRDRLNAIRYYQRLIEFAGEGE